MSGVAGERDFLYEELWKACTGPSVNVPKTGERVFYFTQGHLEHLEALMGQEFNEQIPHFDVASKILCRVIDIQLKAEAETDDVYVQLTLLPESDQTDPLFLEPCIPEPPKPRIHSFCKVVKASDTNTHGGFSILQNHATECLPPLDLQPGIRSRELVAKDLQNYEWTFKHTYRGRPKRHLFTAGWGAFLSSKKLVAGDSFIFLRGEGGEMRVGVRHAQVQVQHTAHTPVLSSQSIHLGILATASHAIAERAAFTVFYKPRISQFVVGVNKYLRAIRNKCTTGTRFRMRFEAVGVPSSSFSGTIVGVGDISPRWPGSQWKSLEVQWYGATTSAHRPRRVSPWEIELIKPTRISSPPSIGSRNKRPRLSLEPSTAASQCPSTSVSQGTHSEKDVLDSQSSSMTKRYAPSGQYSREGNRGVVTRPSQSIHAVNKASSSASMSRREEHVEQHQGSVSVGGSVPFRLFGSPLPTMGSRIKRPQLSLERSTAASQRPSTSVSQATHNAKKDVLESPSSIKAKHYAPPEQSRDGNRGVVKTHKPSHQQTDAGPSQGMHAVTVASSSAASMSRSKENGEQPESRGGHGGRGDNLPFRVFGVDLSSNSG